MCVTPKEASEKLGLSDIVEAPSNSGTITVSMNGPCILSTDKYTEDVDVKLTPCVSSGIRGQLATNNPRIF